ncbi:glycerophosphodiester phosphodiesterase [Sphingobium sp. CR28]|uniref:glycerophosphodiester phosphodiesterase n=1 Tax=Sphingobium sp. CR28 TaxID=3400272 RepID=UPI003FEF8EDC
MTAGAFAAMPMAHSREPRPAPLVIGHRGACALLPEHTLASYERAIIDGADMIEPDLCMTKDRHLIVRHENDISETTNVAAHPEFADRRTRKVVDGAAHEGWFTEDFTLAELKTLQAKERLPTLRPASAAMDGRFPIVTLSEVIDFVAGQARARGRMIGIVPELKHSTYFSDAGLPMEDLFVDVIGRHPYSRSAPLIVQSFETGNLRYLKNQLGQWTNVRLMQLCDEEAMQPADIVKAGGKTTYANMMAPAGLAEMATYADIVAPYKMSIIPVGRDGRLGTPTALVKDAHKAGLAVMPYTFRPENSFLPMVLREGDDPAHRAEKGAIAEIRAFIRAGIDGFFTDDPAIGRAAVSA